MYLLDTDHLSLLDLDTDGGAAIARRLVTVPEEDVAVTIITYEEQMRGWLAYVARANTLERQLQAYRRLRQHIERFRIIPILEYDEQAIAIFQRLRRASVRIGAKD